MDSKPTLLGVEDLSKSYGGVPALDSVTVQFAAGEVHALLGENGAGKSTLVKAIAGVIRADTGKIYGPAHEAGDVAMVFQELSVVPEMSILDNLALVTRGRRGPFVSYEAIRDRAVACLEAVGLPTTGLNHPVEVLSLAQRQLLEIARGLMAEARVLILDEPTATLSDVEIAHVHAVIRKLTGSGTSVVYITHRLGEVFDLSDRITIMRAGRVVAGGATADFQMSTVVTHMLGGDHTRVEKSALRHDGARRRHLTLSDVGVAGRFDDLSFDVAGGEVVALLGQIGSGADDVVRAVAGIVPVEDGEVQLDGVPLKLHNRATAQSAGVAYISADRVQEGVFLDAPVSVNISSGALRRVSTSGIIRRKRELELARSIADTVKLDRRRVREPVSAFSGGNQQKVAVGRALATEPALLVLNEPTRGVDVGARSEIYRSIRGLAAAGVIVLVYSSDVLEIRELADRVITMFRGRLVGVHEVDRVSDDRLLTEILQGAAA